MYIYLPEVVNLAIDEGLVLSLDVIDVADVTGVEVLLHHKPQKAVVWSVCYKTGINTNKYLQTKKIKEIILKKCTFKCKYIIINNIYKYNRPNGFQLFSSLSKNSQTFSRSCI